jgi:hypothetical protein
MADGLENLDVDDIKKSAIIAVSEGSSDAMMTWSEDKRSDFCNVFEQRAQASAYILVTTADKLLEKTHRLQFIWQKAYEKARKERGSTAFYMGKEADKYGYYRNPVIVGGRGADDLNTLAEERADQVFRNLPPLKQAVQVIRPDVALKIDEMDKLKAKLDKLTTELEGKEYTTSLRLSQMDQNMTIGDFRALVKEKIKKRNDLVEKINDAASLVSDLEEWIAKELYAGIPELSDAIVAVAIQHYERAKGLEGMTRRVQEQVKFGDSNAATSLVKRFETDEAEVSDSIKSEFAKALEKLNLSNKQVKKALKAKKV